jgi:methylthioribose-1-phosphate isomerase
MAEAFAPLRWDSGALLLLDQRELPAREAWLRLESWEEVADAIRDMAVRGAPAIGIAAGYGMALAAGSEPEWERAAEGLGSTRPTAVNLHAAIARMRAAGRAGALPAAHALAAEDVELNRRIAAHGAPLVTAGAEALTLCNTGSLATGGGGTALGILVESWRQGRLRSVWSCETRPRLQGLRLTAWELLRAGVPFHSVADSAAASLMASGRVGLVVVGADRIARNGDTANKVGTYMLAVCARHHGVPFYVAAPSTTLDLAVPDGSGIPIEEREASELTHIEGVAVAPPGCPVFNPGFDVTPGALIDAIVTESGVHRPPYGFGGSV